MTEQGWDLWPSVGQTGYDDKSVGVRLLVAGRWYDIDVAYGPDRAAHCPATPPADLAHPIVCALTPRHDGPHIPASVDYMDEMQFTIVGMRTAPTTHSGLPPEAR